MLESGKQFHRLVELQALSAGDVGVWRDPLPTLSLGQHNQQKITGHTGAAASTDRLLTDRIHYLKNLMTTAALTRQ